MITFHCRVADAIFVAGVSGNARQRRSITRRWLKLGWDVERRKIAVDTVARKVILDSKTWRPK